MQQTLEFLGFYIQVFPPEIRGLVLAFLLTLPILSLYVILELFVIRPLHRRANRKISKAFWKQVQTGQRPEIAPRYTDPRTGQLYVDPTELVASGRGRRQIQAVSRLKEQGRL